MNRHDEDRAPPRSGRCVTIKSMAIRILALATASVLMDVASADDSRPVPAPGSFEAVAARAADLARHPFTPAPELPPALRKLNYDTFRLIAFEPAQALWTKERLPFGLELFHRGYLYKEKVQLHLLNDPSQPDPTKPLAFDRKFFQYRGPLASLDVPADVGFAGFRVLGKFESSVNNLEIASFLGASYFRAISEGQVYGSSARGLAIDVGLPKAEEFPAFREFWIDKPTPGQKRLTFRALLDSPSVVGAYEFQFEPGKNTTFDVKARLHFRRQPDNVGLAPITSMWMWGDGRAPPANESRPKVHDCDGLLVHTGTIQDTTNNSKSDEWIWRPISRQTYPSLSTWDFNSVKGFGLLQRDQQFESYRDDQAKYHLRPSVWIEPRQGFTAGAIQLLELPAEHEGVDNVAAWWKPAQTPKVGDVLDLQYVVSFRSSEPSHNLARAVATRVLRDRSPLTVEVDFEGGPLAGMGDEASADPRVTAERGTVQNVQTQKHTGGLWRIRFEVVPAGIDPVELRAGLSSEGRPLSETWRYLCPI